MRLWLLAVLAMAGPAAAHHSNTSANDSDVPEPVSIELRYIADKPNVALVSGDAGKKDRAVTSDMPVRIASISKLVTALGVMRLVDRDVLDLDADVGDYLGWSLRHPVFPDGPVTLRMLLSHTAGLSDAAGYYLPLDGELRQLVMQKDAWLADNAPGSGHFSYANIASPIIAAIMERATGQRFDKIMQSEIFAPLELKACFNWSGCSRVERENAIILLRPNGDLAKDGALTEGESECAFVPASDGQCDVSIYQLGKNGSSFSPQGGLRISAEELLVIGKLLVKDDQNFLTPALWREMQTVQWSSASNIVDSDSANDLYQWALGLEVQPGGWIGHAGDAYGLRAGLWANRETGEVRVNIVTMVAEGHQVGPCLHSCP
jgi:CubicO group peptidase (beta-lactamase class C family)